MWYNGLMTVVTEGKALHISFISDFYLFAKNFFSGLVIF